MMAFAAGADAYTAMCAVGLAFLFAVVGNALFSFF